MWRFKSNFNLDFKYDKYGCVALKTKTRNRNNNEMNYNAVLAVPSCDNNRYMFILSYPKYEYICITPLKRALLSFNSFPHSSSKRSKLYSREGVQRWVVVLIWRPGLPIQIADNEGLGGRCRKDSMAHPSSVHSTWWSAEKWPRTGSMEMRWGPYRSRTDSSPNKRQLSRHCVEPLTVAQQASGTGAQRKGSSRSHHRQL